MIRIDKTIRLNEIVGLRVGDTVEWMGHYDSSTIEFGKIVGGPSTNPMGEKSWIVYWKEENPAANNPERLLKKVRAP